MDAARRRAPPHRRLACGGARLIRTKRPGAGRGFGLPYVACILSLVAVVAARSPAVAQSAAPSAIPAIAAVPAILPPKTPAAAAALGGSQPAHVDYIRLTYVLADGESGPSAEIALGVEAGRVARIEAPVAIAGATGYDVYAVANNGDSGTGEVLQNDAPIAFGTPFVEPESGWRTQGRTLPPGSTNATIEAVPPSGASVAVPRSPSIGGSVVFDTNDSAAGSVVSITTVAPAPGRSRVVAFTFDRTVRFAAYPSFMLIASAGIGRDDPAVVELRDATANRPLVTLDKFEFAAATFLGHVWRDGGETQPFVAEAGHRYEAALVLQPPSMVRLDPRAGLAATLPATNGVSATVRVPPPSDGGGIVLLRSSPAPPNGVPDLRAPAIAEVPFYAVVMIRGNTRYDGEASADVRLASRLPRDATYGLAVYDVAKWLGGWRTGLARVRPGPDGTLHFALDARDANVHARRYVVALYRERGRGSVAARPTGSGDAATRAMPAARTARRTRPLVAVVGDSVSLVTSIAPSAPRCSVLIEAAPNCQYLTTVAGNYATQAARLAGDDVVNLSWIGTKATEDWELGESALTLSVPQIPRDASVVVLACGLLDVAFANPADASARLDVITNAIRATVPHARIVYVGMRYFNETATVPQQRALVDAWDERARTLATRYGAFFDMRPVVPGSYDAFAPDGTHLSAEAHALVAAALAPVIAGQTARR